MKVKTKSEKEFECTPPIEQKIYRDQEPQGWVCSFSLIGNVSTSDIDDAFSTDNIDVLTFSNDKYSFTIEGYAKVNSIIVRHTESGTYTDIQIIKGSDINATV